MLNRYLSIGVASLVFILIASFFYYQGIEVSQKPQNFFGIVELEETAIVAHIPGKVQLIKVQKGEEVQRGQEVVVLENFQAEMELTQAEEGLEVVREGLRQLKSLSKEEELERGIEVFQHLEERLDQIKSDIEIEGNLLDQVIKLNAMGLVSDQKVRELRLSHQETLDELNKIMKEVRDTTWSLERISQNTAWQREMELLTKEKELETVKALAQKKIQQSAILAPEAGMVANLEVKEGDFVGVGKIIGTLQGSQRPLLKVYIPAEKIQWVAEKGKVTVIDKDFISIGEGVIQQIGHREEIDPRDKLSGLGDKKGVHLITIRLDGKTSWKSGSRLGIVLGEASNGLGN